MMWLSERVITKSPFSFITLGIELTLHKIFPIYVPQSCRNEADSRHPAVLRHRVQEIGEGPETVQVLGGVRAFPHRS